MSVFIPAQEDVQLCILEGILVLLKDCSSAIKLNSNSDETFSSVLHLLLKVSYIKPTHWPIYWPF